MATYRTTRRIWTGAPLAALPIGSLVEFDGEPTGVYKGRCELVAEVEAPKKGKKAPADPPAPPAPPAG